MQHVVEYHEIIPRLKSYTRVAHCLMLYNWHARVGPDWLTFAEDVLRHVNLEAADCVATRGQQKSRGNYRRVRKRLVEFLDGSLRGADRCNVIINAGPIEGGEAFFPFRAQIVLNCLHPAQVSALVAMDESLVPHNEDLVTICGKAAFEQLGPAYGCAMDFPCALGPDAYLATLVAQPNGVEREELEVYGRRLTRWRDRRWSGLRPESGYLREVYPTNFVLDGHLKAPFAKGSFADFMRSTGRLVPSGLIDGVFRWDVGVDNLAMARARLEDSGLVLSAAAEPLSLSNQHVAAHPC